MDPYSSSDPGRKHPAFLLIKLILNTHCLTLTVRVSSLDLWSQPPMLMITTIVIITIKDLNLKIGLCNTACYASGHTLWLTSHTASCLCLRCTPHSYLAHLRLQKAKTSVAKYWQQGIEWYSITQRVTSFWLHPVFYIHGLHIYSMEGNYLST